MKLRTISTCLATAAMLLPLYAEAQETARMAPANTGVFIEINNLAEHRADWEADPVAKLLRDHFPSPPQSAEWLAVQDALEMTSEQIIDTFFGQTIALIGREPGPNQPVVLLSRIVPEDGEKARERLLLVEGDKVGNFRTYTTTDGRARFAFNGEWMAIANVDHDEYLREVLGHDADTGTLADDDNFIAWMERVPQDRTGTVYMHNRTRGETHVLGIVKPDRNTTLHYAGYSPAFRQIFARLSDAERFDFGPVPRSTLAALTLNVYDPNPRPGRANAFLDQLLAPTTLREVMGQLEAPTVFFFGEVPGQQLDQNPGFAVPVIGLAIKLRDETAAEHLDRGFNNAMLMLSLAAASSPQPLPQLNTRQATHAGTRYNVVNLGELLAVQSQRPELKHMQLAYGRIKDWYVICSQEMFFRQAISSQRGDFAPADAANDMQPIARGFVRPTALGTHLIGLAEHFSNQNLPNVAPDTWPNLKVLGQAMTFYKSVNLQFHRADDDAIIGKLEVLRED